MSFNLKQEGVTGSIYRLTDSDLLNRQTETRVIKPTRYVVLRRSYNLKHHNRSSAQ